MLNQEPFSIMVISAITALMTAFSTIIHAYAESQVSKEMRKEMANLEARVRVLESK